MASEYWKWKFQDVRPEEKVVLTPKQKRKNWWHYHKWHLLIGVVLAAAIVDIAFHMLGIGRVFPDYQIAYVGTAQLPDAAVDALERALAQLGEDCNGDGQVAVAINQYVNGGTDAANAYYSAAASTKIMADLSAMDSYFFLLEDPEQFQLDYHALRRLDGSLPADSDADWSACCLRWTDCPTLSALELGEYEDIVLGQKLSGDAQALFSEMYIARRGFWTERTCEHVEACDALWDEIAKDAQPSQQPSEQPPEQ